MVFQIVVALRRARPRVWRRVLVRDDMRLSELHDVLQIVTGADTGYHVFSLSHERRRSVPGDFCVADEDELRLRLGDVAGEGTRLHYDCIGAERWRYRLDVEAVRPVDVETGYPVCLAGRLAFPGAGTSSGFDLGLINQRLVAVQRLSHVEQASTFPAARERRRARDMLVELLRSFPMDTTELGSRLGGLAPRALRDELLVVVERRSETFSSRRLVMEAFAEIGLGDAVERLRVIAVDTTRPLRVRGLAFDVLSAEEPTATASVLVALTEEERELLLREQFKNLFVSTLVDPDTADLLAQTLADQVALGDDEFIEFLEACRIHAGVPAVVAYGEALRSPGLIRIRSRLLEILVSAGGSQVATLLECVRDESEDAVWRRWLQRALLRVLTDVIEGRLRTPALGGRAWLSGCDGSGWFVVFAHIETPGAGGCFVRIAACLDGGFRDAAVVPRASGDEAQRLLSSFVVSAGGRLVAVPLDEAAARLALVARQTRERAVEVPRTVRAAIELIESTWSRAPLPAPASRSARAVDVEQVRSLLERPAYMDGWSLEPAALDDLRAGGASAGTAAWRRRAMKRIATSGSGQRLRAMCLFMARWHELDHDRDAAALCRGMAAGLERGSSSNALCSVLLDTALRPGAVDESAPRSIGDSSRSTRSTPRSCSTP